MDTLQTPEFTTGEQALAWAVIEQAFKDANNSQDSYERNCSRNFLQGKKIWRGSLRFWCSLAGVPAEFIMYQAKKKWGQVGLTPNLHKGDK